MNLSSAAENIDGAVRAGLVSSAGMVDEERKVHVFMHKCILTERL